MQHRPLPHKTTGGLKKSTYTRNGSFALKFGTEVGIGTYFLKITKNLIHWSVAGHGSSDDVIKNALIDSKFGRNKDLCM